MNPGYIYRTWALAEHEGEEKPAVNIHSRVPSLPSSVSKVSIIISRATVRHLPCPNTYCSSHQMHWAHTVLCKFTGIWCEFMVPVTATFAHPLKAWKLLEMQNHCCTSCVLPSLHSAAVRKVVADGSEEMSAERLLLTEAQLALSIDALPAPFLHLPQISVGN